MIDPSEYQQMALFAIDTAAVERPSGRQIRARRHLVHPRDEQVALCNAPMAKLKRQGFGLTWGTAVQVIDCRTCNQHAKRMHWLELNELYDAVEVLSDVTPDSNTGVN